MNIFLWLVISILASYVSSRLWRAGGRWNKNIRRFGVPFLIASLLYVFSGWSWSLPFLLLAYIGVLRLPFTLSGDAVQGSILNWIWIWIHGLLLGAPIILISPAKWYLAFIPMLTQGIFGTLSNIKETSHLAPWKFVECLVGFSVAVSICLSK